MGDRLVVTQMSRPPRRSVSPARASILGQFKINEQSTGAIVFSPRLLSVYLSRKSRSVVCRRTLVGGGGGGNTRRQTQVALMADQTRRLLIRRTTARRVAVAVGQNSRSAKPRAKKITQFNSPPDPVGRRHNDVDSIGQRSGATYSTGRVQ
uniref:Uncharacterized protein n=1 Tax=Plectus sambesii TaxID=2011161 RepID=A0A914VZU4_9BILA